jgi:hypothetical protein
MAPRATIVRSGRPRSEVSLGATPSPADISSKNDALKRGNQCRAPNIIRSGSPNLGFPPEQSKSSDENNKENAFTKVASSKDTVIVRHDRCRGSVFTSCHFTQTCRRLNQHRRSINSGGEEGHLHRAWDCHPRLPRAAAGSSRMLPCEPTSAMSRNSRGKTIAI